MLQLCAAGGCVLSAFAPVTSMPSPGRGFFCSLSARQLLVRFPTSDPSSLHTHAAAYACEPSACTSCPCVLARFLLKTGGTAGDCDYSATLYDRGERSAAATALHNALPRRSCWSPTCFVRRWASLCTTAVGAPLLLLPLGVPASCPLVGVCLAASPAPVWRRSRLGRFVRVPLDIPFGPLTRLSCVVFVFVSGFLASGRPFQGEPNLGCWGGGGHCRARLAAPRRRAVRRACGAGRMCTSRRGWRGLLYPAAAGVPLLASLLVLGGPAGHLPHAARRREDHDPGCLAPAPCRRVPSALLPQPQRRDVQARPLSR